MDAADAADVTERERRRRRRCRRTVVAAVVPCVAASVAAACVDGHVADDASYCLVVVVTDVVAAYAAAAAAAVDDAWPSDRVGTDRRGSCPPRSDTSDVAAVDRWDPSEMAACAAAAVASAVSCCWAEASDHLQRPSCAAGSSPFRASAAAVAEW